MFPGIALRSQGRERKAMDIDRLGGLNSTSNFRPWLRVAKSKLPENLQQRLSTSRKVRCNLQTANGPNALEETIDDLLLLLAVTPNPKLRPGPGGRLGTARFVVGEQCKRTVDEQPRSSAGKERCPAAAVLRKPSSRVALCGRCIGNN